MITSQRRYKNVAHALAGLEEEAYLKANEHIVESLLKPPLPVQNMHDRRITTENLPEGVRECVGGPLFSSLPQNGRPKCEQPPKCRL